MPPLSEPTEELEEKYVSLVTEFVSDLKNGKIVGSVKIALSTVALLERILSDAQHASAQDLLRRVRGAGRLVAHAVPHEVVVGNMVRRVLRVIRDEQPGGAGGVGEGGGESLQRLVRTAAVRRGTVGPAAGDTRCATLEHIAELRAELEGGAEAVAEQAREHIHADELVLTYGASGLTERFLRRAAAVRRYRLILVEDRDSRESQAMAARLSACGVRVTVVGAAGAAGVMSRVNKVIAGARGVLAGGALVASAGAHAIATAAKHYSVPVIVLAPLYKLSPAHACDQHYFTSFLSPEPALWYGCAGRVSQVFAPRYDYVPPDLVTLFLTNLGGSSPSYVYRLLSELYDTADYQL